MNCQLCYLSLSPYIFRLRLYIQGGPACLSPRAILVTVSLETRDPHTDGAGTCWARTSALPAPSGPRDFASMPAPF